MLKFRVAIKQLSITVKNEIPMQDKITISRETFAALLSFAKREQTTCENNARNAAKKVQELPGDEFWQDSVKFWEHERQNAESTYKKALEEAQSPTRISEANKGKVFSA